MYANEICYLMELRKKLAELEFKKGYFIHKGMQNEDAQIILFCKEIAEISKQALLLENKIIENGGVIFFPNEVEISILNDRIAQVESADIYDAMKTKHGDIYALLEKRGKFLKNNFENRHEIATLVQFVNSLPSKIRDDLIGMVKKGCINEIDVSMLEEQARTKLFKLLNRSSIVCFLEGYKLLSESENGITWNEKKVDLNGSGIWIDPEKEEEIKKFSEELSQTAVAIQITNAERQVRKFEAEEESRFNELQKKYIALIRKREGLFSW